MNSKLMSTYYKFRLFDSYKIIYSAVP